MLALMEITISFAYQWIISILIQHVRSYNIRVICTAKFISTPLLYQIKKKPSHEVVYKVYDYNIEIHATKHKKLIFFFSYTELIAYLIASKPLQIPENRPVLHIHVHILI